MGRFIGALNYRDTKFDDIRIDTQPLNDDTDNAYFQNYQNTAIQIFLARSDENESKPCLNGGSLSCCINKANWKQVRSMGMLWHTRLFRGNGLSTDMQDKSLLFCFGLNKC